MHYSAIVAEHFERPHNVAAGCDVATHVGRAGSEAGGAIIEFHLVVSDGRIGRVTFRAWGCPHTIALASWLTDELRGRELAAATPLDIDAVAAALELPTPKWHCILTAEDALRAAMEERNS